MLARGIYFGSGTRALGRGNEDRTMADSPPQKLGSDHGPNELRIAAGAALFALLSLFLVYLAVLDRWASTLLSLTLLAIASLMIWGETSKGRTGSRNTVST